jgi:hypothetical protein
MLSKIQAHPYHLVEPSPWPLTGSLALLILTTTAVMNFHGWNTTLGLSIGIISVLITMVFWWRDCIRESSYKSLFQEKFLVFMLTICWKLFKPIIYRRVLINWYIFLCKNLINKRISKKLIMRIFRDYTLVITSNDTVFNNHNIGPYLTGLIEGDGHFYIQSDENIKLNRKHNPQIVITFDKKNLPWIQNIHTIIDHGYIKITEGNTCKFIITDKKGLIKIVN